MPRVPTRQRVSIRFSISSDSSPQQRLQSHGQVSNVRRRHQYGTRNDRPPKKNAPNLRRERHQEEDRDRRTERRIGVPLRRVRGVVSLQTQLDPTHQSTPQRGQSYA